MLAITEFHPVSITVLISMALPINRMSGRRQWKPIVAMEVTRLFRFTCSSRSGTSWFGACVAGAGAQEFALLGLF